MSANLGGSDSGAACDRPAPATRTSRLSALGSELANELRGRQTTGNAVTPGPVATDFFLDGKSDELIEALENSAPLERLGQQENTDSTVAFLASGQGGWISAQVIRANGGFS